MLKPLPKKYKGLITVSGPVKSGKSQLAEFLLKEQESITYIATSKPRENDQDWQRKILIHRERRPDGWILIEHPRDICQTILSLRENQSILIDSLGGLVEQKLKLNEDQWELFQGKFVNCLINNNLAIIVVSEEIGWGVVPSTPIGHLFRERLSNLLSLISNNSATKWLAINGTAIELNTIGTLIP